MNEHPILFSDAMIRAILDGRKTQTRRPICWPRLQRSAGLIFPTNCRLAHFDLLNGWGLDAGDGVLRAVRCPYGQPGDQLWVREAFGCSRQDDDANNRERVLVYRAGMPYRITDTGQNVIKRAESGLPIEPNHYVHPPCRWVPSIFMPRWASRITLDVLAVRVERVRDITPEGCIAEGFSTTLREHDACYWLRCQFRQAWDSIYSARVLGWDANPWVWVVEFMGGAL